MDPQAYPRKQRALFGLQIGLRQLLLATLCAGVWFAHWANQDAIARLEPRLANFQTLSPELIVAEPRKIAVVQLPSPWYSISSWEVYVPTDKVRICLATEDIAETGFPGKFESVLLPKGQYKVQLEEQQETSRRRFLVSQTDQVFLELESPRDAASGGSSTESDVGSQTKQSDGDVPIVLVRRRYFVPIPGTPGSSTSPKGPAKGLLLWLQNDR